jgi:predicted nucleotidyltransferase
VRPEQKRIYQSMTPEQKLLIAADLYHCARALSLRRQITIERERVGVVPREYVIIRKLQYYREGSSEKHLKDIAGMVALSSDQIDYPLLEEMVGRYSLEKEWLKARSLAGR